MLAERVKLNCSHNQQVKPISTNPHPVCNVPRNLTADRTFVRVFIVTNRPSIADEVPKSYARFSWRKLVSKTIMIDGGLNFSAPICKGNNFRDIARVDAKGFHRGTTI